MNKLLNAFVIITATTAAISLCASTAQAAITGKIGVGTWNSQAEFADVKVVQGTTPLYQSDFASNVTGWTTSGGTWARQNGYFRQTGSGTPAMAWVGDTSWSDYTLTLKARKISGSEGFLITFGAPGDVTNSWWNVGGWNNTKHVITAPGIVAPDAMGDIQTGVWYDVKVQLSGNDVKCYLNGALIQSTTRVLDAPERTARIQDILNSPGYQLLTPVEKTSLQELFNRNVYVGQAARDTFSDMPSSDDFTALSALQQLALIRKVGAKRMTWKTGWGFGNDLAKDQQIINSMDSAVILHNSIGVFDKQLTANNSPGTPTADGGYNGELRFGGQRGRFVAIHEIAHTLGVGTHGSWGGNMSGGTWNGVYARTLIKQYDGGNAEIHATDSAHFREYGINQGYESNPTNDYRHVKIVEAMRRDMGIASTLWMPTSTSVANGTYRLVPRNASWTSLSVHGSGSNSTPTVINQYVGTDNQKFSIDLQSDGTYRIRTALSGNRPIELPGGATDNGTAVKLWDDNGNSAQRWYLIPMGDGWFKIAPKNDMGKGLDINGGAGSTADGTSVQVWNYLDGTNQQWKFAPATVPSYSTTIANGTYRLTPRHANGSAMEVLDSNSANNTPLGIRTYTGATNQQFLLDLRSDGSYRIRTALTDNRTVDLPYGNTVLGNKPVIYDNTNTNNQRWYFVPTGSGYYKIVPKVDMDTKCIDVAGGTGATADGTPVHNWDYYGATNQQWQLTPVTSNSALAASQSSGTRTTSTRTTSATKKVSPKTAPVNPSAGSS